MEAEMIITERLEIVPLDEKYVEELYELWGDYEVIKYTYNNLLKSPQECHNRLVNWLDLRKDNDGPNKFAILLKGKMIGIIGYPVIESDNFKCGFFYQLIKSYWGKGYTYEAARAVIAYIFQLHADATIIAEAVTDNIASVRILNRLGFVQTGIQQKGFKNNSLELDIYQFELHK